MSAGSKIEQLLWLAQQEYRFRKYANKNYRDTRTQYNPNPDFDRVKQHRGLYSKALPHDDDGYASDEAMICLINTIYTDNTALSRLKLPGEMKLCNITCIYSLDLVGPYRNCIYIPPNYSCKSKQMGTEMVWLYALSLVRDLPACLWNENPLILGAVDDLNRAGCSDFPRDDAGRMAAPLIFRGDTLGDRKGPYFSQFFYFSYKDHLVEITPKYAFYSGCKNFMQTVEATLKCQSGTVPEGVLACDPPRYMLTLRDGATFVHKNDPLAPYLNLVKILDTMQVPKNLTSPTSKQEDKYVDLGSLDLSCLLAEVIRVSTIICWHYKWSLLRLRPEAYALETHREKTGQYKGMEPICPENLLESDILRRIFEAQGTYCLSQCYPEGAPCHPAYPSSHAIIAGACTTLIKMWYNGNTLIDAVRPNEVGTALVRTDEKLCVEDELDKFASNMAIFRCAAGVNYWSDCVIGLNIGEQIAIELMRDMVMRYPYKTVFKFKRRSGLFIEITNNDVFYSDRTQNLVQTEEKVEPVDVTQETIREPDPPYRRRRKEKKKKKRLHADDVENISVSETDPQPLRSRTPSPDSAEEGKQERKTDDTSSPAPIGERTYRRTSEKPRRSRRSRTEKRSQAETSVVPSRRKSPSPPRRNLSPVTEMLSEESHGTAGEKTAPATT